jgi:methionyl-tRNA formyltransferase
LDIRLVVTHEDSPGEVIWFGSVAETARRNGIAVISPQDPNTAQVIDQLKYCQPDYLFSFYYRNMLKPDLLDIPKRGAFNVHGSLLPRYRGRVPVNWAIIHGEKECGVSLHRMVAKPDAGNLLAQHAVPILTNDTAHDVFQKLKCAAESLLLETVPEMIQGRAKESPQDLRQGSYFSGRKPEDGRLDWSRTAWEVHNLIRAVAPPYPGAFFDHGGHRIELLGSYFRAEQARHPEPCIYLEHGKFWADCADGFRILITRLQIDGAEADPTVFSRLFQDRLVLTSTSGKASPE